MKVEHVEGKGSVCAVEVEITALDQMVGVFELGK